MVLSPILFQLGTVVTQLAGNEPKEEVPAEPIFRNPDAYVAPKEFPSYRCSSEEVCVHPFWIDWTSNLNFIRPRSPVEIYIEKADIKVSADFADDISCNDWRHNSVDIEFDGGKIFGALSIQDNFFFLRRDILQTCGVEINGIAVDVSDPRLTFWYPPHYDGQGRLMEYGELWLTATPDQFLSASNWLFSDGPVGTSLNPKLPGALKEENGSLSSTLWVPDLLGVFFGLKKSNLSSSDFPYVKNCYSEGKDSDIPLNIFEDILRNVRIELNVGKIRKLVFPNGMAMGPSSLNATVTFPSESLQFPKLDIPTFEFEIMPWVFQSSPQTGKAEWAFLGGKIWAHIDDSGIVEKEGQEVLSFDPGLHVKLQPSSFVRPHVNGVIHFSFDLLLPLVKNVTISGSLLVNTEFVLSEGVFKPRRGATYLRFKDIEVINSKSGEKLINRFNLTLTDIPAFTPNFSQEGFVLSLQAHSRDGQEWKFESHTDIPLKIVHLLEAFPHMKSFFDKWGSQEAYLVYELPSSIDHLFTHTRFDFQSDKQHTQGSIHTGPANMLWVDPLFFLKNPTAGTQITFDYSQRSTDGKQLSMLSRASILLGMVRGARDLFRLQFRAERFQWKDFLELHNPGVSLALDRVRLDEDTFKLSLKDFHIRANDKGESCISQMGKVRGPVHLKLSSVEDKALEVEWRPKEKRVAFSGADFAFSFQGLYDPLLAANSRGLVHYFSLDGRFTGSMQDLSYDPRYFVGFGSLGLVGNQDGPYLIDPSTRRRKSPTFLRDEGGNLVDNPYPLGSSFNPRPGDMQLLNSACQMVGPPYFSWTHWQANAIGEKWVRLTLKERGRRVDKWLPYRDVYIWVDGSYRPRRRYARQVKAQEPLPQRWKTALPTMEGDDPNRGDIFKGYAWGDYHLEVDMDQRTLRPFGVIMPLLGTFELPSNNVYFLPRGLGAIEKDFLDEQEKHPYSKLLWFFQPQKEGGSP